MKILAFSDTHGYIYPPEKVLPQCDVICIAGDIIPLCDQTSMERSKEWLEQWWIPYMLKMKEKTGAQTILMTPGNHDFIFEHEEFLPEFPEGIEVLIDRSYLAYVDGQTYEFYGMPWLNMTTRTRWAFDTKDDAKVKEKLDLMPSTVNVLLTHCPPYGEPSAQQFGDNWYNGGKRLKDFGSKPLKERLDSDVDADLLLVICGHIHEQVLDDYENLQGTRVCNVSVKDEEYNIYKEPKLIEI